MTEPVAICDKLSVIDMTGFCLAVYQRHLYLLVMSPNRNDHQKIEQDQTNM